MALPLIYPELISKIIIVMLYQCLSALMNPSCKSNENIDCSAFSMQITSATNEQFYQMQKQGIGRH